MLNFLIILYFYIKFNFIIFIETLKFFVHMVIIFQVYFIADQFHFHILDMRPLKRMVRKT